MKPSEIIKEKLNGASQVSPQTPDSMDWEKEFLDKFACKCGGKICGNVWYENCIDDLLEFIKKHLALAHSSGRKEGEAKKGQVKREWYQMGFDEGRRKGIEEAIRIVKNKRGFWNICDDEECNNRKSCEIANHYVKTIWNPAFDDIINSLLE